MAKQIKNEKPKGINCIPASFSNAPSSVKSDKINSIKHTFGK